MSTVSILLMFFEVSTWKASAAPGVAVESMHWRNDAAESSRWVSRRDVQKTYQLQCHPSWVFGKKGCGIHLTLKHTRE